MVKVMLPYGKGHLPLEVKEKDLMSIVYPRTILPDRTPEQYIIDALSFPELTSKLGELAIGKKSVAIVVDDYTRPCPTSLILPPVLKEVYSAGIAKADVKIVFASGTHRAVREQEAFRLLGGGIAKQIGYLSNECKGSDFEYIGKTSKGTPVKIKETFLDADLKILLGDVEIHYFAGYGGGRKSVLPGIAHYSTIQHNYTTNFFHPNAKPGVLDGNPMHENMTEAARLAEPDFCLNVVQNSDRKIVGAFAGDFDPVLRKGAQLVDKMYKVDVPHKADIVITAADGYPHDVNLYQAYKAVHLAKEIVREGGVIVLVAQSPEGHGYPKYHEWMERYESANDMAAELKKEFIPGGHKAYYHMLLLEKVRWILVSDMPKDMVEKTYHLIHAKDPQEALKKAFEHVGKDAKILVIPKGTSTLPQLR